MMRDASRTLEYLVGRVHFEHRIRGFHFVGGREPVDLVRGRPPLTHPRSCHARSGTRRDGRHAPAYAAAQVLVARSVVGHGSAHMVDDGVDLDIDTLARAAVFHFDKTIVNPASGNDDGGHANQFCIFKTNPG